jgi:hypothetical protein
VASGLKVMNLLVTINAAGRYRAGRERASPERRIMSRRFAIADTGPHPLERGDRLEHN